MNFEDAVKYLKSFVAYDDEQGIEYNEKNFNVSRIKDFVDLYGVNYSRMKFVHVGGSKGKGSVSFMLSQQLCLKGFKTGLFTSPYFVDMTESFCVDGAQMKKSVFVKYVKELKKFIEVSGGTALTCFELIVVIALKYFLDNKVEYVVWETGLGGRFDATNVIDPFLTVITFLEEEHTDFFGKGLNKVIKEEVGIVRRGVPVIVGPQAEGVKKILKNCLRGLTKIYFANKFSVHELKFENLAQKQNAATVFKVLEILFHKVDKKKFIKSVSRFKLEGRFDVRKIRGRTVVFDVAHTLGSIKNLTNSLRLKFPRKEYLFLFSVMKEKSHKIILKEISKVSSGIVFTSSHEKRGVRGEELYVKYNGLFKHASFNEDPYKTYLNTLKGMKKNQILVVTGSHFLIAEIFSKIK